MIVILGFVLMPKTYFDHEKLGVYQRALQFVAFAHPLVAELPAKFSARDQLERAPTSILLNLAEGNGKRAKVDRCRYLGIARGSALEWAACLDILVLKQPLDPTKAAEGKDLLVAIVSMLMGLLDVFGAQLHEEPAPDGARADSNIPAEQDHD
jgi:four helix bundle protein